MDIKHFFKQEQIGHEIIVVDDGSKDNTVQVAQECLPEVKILRHKRNLGKGAAVRTGVLEASGKYILFMDADNSTRIQELKKFLPLIRGGLILIGSRYLKDSYIQASQPRLRIILGRIGNIIIRVLLIKGIHDTQCGFKLFSHGAAKKIFEAQTIQGFAFDIEILALARYFGYSIKEIPINWHNELKGTLSYKSYLLSLRDLFLIKRNFICKRYPS